MADQPGYVIWSNEHDAFWGPDRRGYVSFAHAGRYTREEADEILERAWCPGHKDCCDGKFPHEVALQVAAESVSGGPRQLRGAR
jgi:hypothetical protein